MAGERTEAATPRRLQELRAQGRVLKSVDLNAALGLLAGWLVVQQFGGTGFGRLREYLQDSLRNLGRPDLTESTLAELGRGGGEVFLAVLGPLLVLLPLAAIASNLGQSGPLLSGRALAPDPGRLNPLAALGRLCSARALVELLKTLLKVGLLTCVLARVLVDSLPRLASLGGPNLAASSALLGELTVRLGLTAAAALLALGLLDYGYQRWEFGRSTRMSHEELREELRQTEGSPQIRARIRQRQRKLAASRMMHAVPSATVVVTNPIHLAVALTYDDSQPGAPRVVAKGAGPIAERIKGLAREHDVPLVENQPLARALYRSVEIGMQIPLELFQAVAEVLAYVYSLRAQGEGRHDGAGA